MANPPPSRVAPPPAPPRGKMLQAYAAASACRSLREQEADVFRRTNAMLRRARDAGVVAEARALADNDRLWSAVLDLVRDPENQLPAALRANIVSIGVTVRRETQSLAPDWDFLVTVNENMAAGLSGLP